MENLYVPTFVDITASPGKEMASASTVFMLITVLFILMMYNLCTCRVSKAERKILMSLWDSVLASMYAVSCIFFELQVIYGHEISKKLGTETSEGLSFITLISWLIVNVLCVPSLMFSCCSKEKYRMLIYLPFTFHLCGLGIILGEMLARPLSGVNIIIVSMMQIMALVVVYRIPRAFRIDEKRWNMEQTRKDQDSSAKYSLVKEEDNGMGIQMTAVKASEADKLS